MNSRSLLDYFAESQTSDKADVARHTAELLEQRLAELEDKLAAAARPAQAPVQPLPVAQPEDETFSSQIESILRRHREHSERSRVERTQEDRQTARQYPRMEMPSPPLAADVADQRSVRPAEFTKFVEAVHLIGQAASRLLQSPEPARLALPVRESLVASEDTLQLTSALRETIAAFQSMSADLISAAADIRRSADLSKVEAAPQPSSRRVAREDAELFRLQDDLEDLRDRLGAMTRRRSRDSY